MFLWLIGIVAVVVFIALSVFVGLLVGRHARTDEGRLAILKIAFWLLATSSCVYFWSLLVLLIFGHYPRSVLLVVVPFATLICATIGMGLNICALREKIDFAKLPNPEEPAQREFQFRHQRLTRMAARVIIVFAMLQFESVALNYFTQLRTDADLAYQKILIDSRQDAIKHWLRKLPSADHSKSDELAVTARF